MSALRHQTRAEAPREGAEEVRATANQVRAGVIRKLEFFTVASKNAYRFGHCARRAVPNRSSFPAKNLRGPETRSSHTVSKAGMEGRTMKRIEGRKH